MMLFVLAANDVEWGSRMWVIFLHAEIPDLYWGQSQLTTCIYLDSLSFKTKQSESAAISIVYDLLTKRLIKQTVWNQLL